MTTSYLGLDLGTSGLKAVLWSDQGELVGEAESGYAVDRPGEGRAQTPVPRWDAALSDVLDQLEQPLRSSPVAAVGIDGQMHGLVLVDADGAALAPALLWSDLRAGAEVDRYRQLTVDQRARLANPLVPGMTGPLLAWLVRHEPQLVEQAHAALLPKDAFRSLLVPSVVTDRSDAAATLLWDVTTDTWASDVAEALDIPLRLLPTTLPADQVVGATERVHAGGRRHTEVPVVVGAGDTPAARLALGPGAGTQVNLGSGGQVIAPVTAPQPVAGAVVHTYADAAGGWYRMVALQSAGLALDWVRGILGMSWAELYAAADSAKDGVSRVLFLPFLHGERGGVAGPSARAGWLGADADSTREDLARAAVEGVVFAVARACELVQDPSRQRDVALTGGGGRPPVVARLLADTLGQPVTRHELRSASATGAAVLAARGVGRTLAPAQPAPVSSEPGHRHDALQETYGRWRLLVAQQG